MRMPLHTSSLFPACHMPALKVSIRRGWLQGKRSHQFTVLNPQQAAARTSFEALKHVKHGNTLHPAIV